MGIQVVAVVYLGAVAIMDAKGFSVGMLIAIGCMIASERSERTS